MILRDYQKKLIESASGALAEHKNTLAVAATGSGKTIMLSSLAGKIGGKTLILQHRDELTAQNCQKFRKLNPRWKTSLYNATEKDFSGDAVFSMVQTLSRHISDIPKFDHLIIDEAHHSCALSYLRILNQMECKNPAILISGWTATPARGDKLGLSRAGFDNCCAEISIQELVELGFLVNPVCYARELDGFDLKGIRRPSGGEYDMEEAAEQMDVEINNESVFHHWKDLAGERKTIVFASTIDHAKHVCQTFQAHGIKSDVLTSETSDIERKMMLQAFDQGNLQVIFNVAVLTEGYDSQPVSCIVLLRPCSFKSTMIQMIGRGLRIVDAEIYPNVIKNDCIILDFGESLKTHGDLFAGKGLDDKTKICPVCKSIVPPKTRFCQICGFDFAPEFQKGEFKAEKEKEIISDIRMVELKILKQSPFLWVDLFESGKVMIASGFSAMAGVISADGINYIAVGKVGKDKMKILQKGIKTLCLSKADDFLRTEEQNEAAKKSRRWLKDDPSEKQINLLSQFGYGKDFRVTKYSANCHLQFQWNLRAIEKCLKTN